MIPNFKVNSVLIQLLLKSQIKHLAHVPGFAGEGSQISYTYKLHAFSMM